jgi:superfamily II DNA or RNA helicase
MSYCISVNQLTSDQVNSIIDELEITLDANKYKMNQSSEIIPLYSFSDGIITLPFAYAHQTLGFPRLDRSQFLPANIQFTGQLRDFQREIRKEAIPILNKWGSVLISSFTGSGKSIIALNLVSRIKLKTLIIANKIVLLTQWMNYIEQFCSTIAQIIKPQTVINEEASIFVINAINIAKLPSLFLQKIGTIIVDESHLILARTISTSLHLTHPRYLIGLSATPFRYDNLDVLFKHFFGNGKIIRKLWIPHTVYKVNTGITLKTPISTNGRYDWNAILESQSEHIQRNELIIKIVTQFSDRVFFILTKRVKQVMYLVNRLQTEGEHVTYLARSKQDFDKTARILIGVNSKIGTGFDHPRLNTLLLASDVENYFIQYLGRITRRSDQDLMVFDLVDSNSTLEKHFKTRKSVYLEHGGKIQNVNANFFA